MDITIEIDLSQAARELNLPLESVQRTVALLDDGNTVPFITRYRKDQTGALDEEQIRRIQEKVGKLRGLAERKQTILRSIQSQGVLSGELFDQIRSATSLKRLEDLYLPYKPKKQTLATTARQRGLEPLAREVLEADPAAADLQQRCEMLVSADNQLPSADDVMVGVRHIIAEWFSERADVRGRLRKILQQSGKLICSRVEPAKAGEPAAASGAEPATAPSAEVVSGAQPPADAWSEQQDADSPDPMEEEVESAEGVVDAGDEDEGAPPEGDMPVAPDPAAEAPSPESPAPAIGDPVSVDASAQTRETLPGTTEGEQGAEDAAGVVSAEGPTFIGPTESVGEASAVLPEAAAPPAATPIAAPAAPPMPARQKSKAKRGPLSAAISKKEKKRQRLEAAFKDYYAFQELVARIPPHRVLAINRGERARILRVKIDADADAMAAEAESLLIAAEHPHREFLKSCLRDALCRLLIPSLERELRREMTEKAEEHAVEVFARNLRKLLLQPPVHNHRVLAVDPGFRSGCKLIALDEFGNVLAHEIIHVIGKEEWIRNGRNKLVELVRRHRLSVVAIGNGAGCRETEQLVVDVIENELREDDVAFVIVNEAGASVYSTSPLGREELPGYDAVLRSAISIGRRLLDPLSELVKINPANIGVGMYQHDVKAKHLRNSLDAVVESCVNYVGVDVNTASPALLRYVSGMNQLTARRLCEYRAKHGPFRNRQQLKEVPGLGEATFVQAAGFLKVTSGDNPLDATWIHPESYELAERVLQQADCSLEDLSSVTPASRPVANKPRPFGQLDLLPPVTAEALAQSEVESLADAVTADPVPQAITAADSATPSVQDQEPPGGAVDDASAPPQPEESAVTPPMADTSQPLEPVADIMSAEPPQVADGHPEEGVATSVEVPHEASEHETNKAKGESTAAESTADQQEQEAEGITLRCRRLYDKFHQLDVPGLAAAWCVSDILLQDILNSLARPGRDPREDLPAPVFRHGIVKLEDLEPGMMLSGTVLNVVDFGAFVDIGLSDSGLVHISRLADRFVRDPHEVVGVGDVLTVWVVDIDKQRRRVSLTAIEPGTEKPVESRRKPDQPHPRRQSAKRPPRPPRPVPAEQSTGTKAKGKPPREKSRDQGRPPRKPKVITPITKEMEEGKEPLRSFSDLMQFYQKKQTDGNKS